MRRVGTIVLAVGLGVSVLAGCGGEETTNASGDKQPQQAKSEQKSEPKDSSEPTQSEEASGEDAAFCSEVSKMADDILGGNAKPTEDLAAKYEQIAEVAPSEVKGDWQAVANSMDVLLDAQKDMKEDPASVDSQKLQKASKEMEPAIKNIMQDMKNRCQVVAK